MMKILVACEYSGIVRDAFIAKGHDAMSCDLLPTERPGPHYQGDVFDIINDGWDMMIAHPPCTYLTNAGIGYFNEERYGFDAVVRKDNREQAAAFFMRLVNAPIDKICIENPVGWMNSHYRKADQTIHPYFFGDPHKKRTCLWLKNLPLLIYNKHIAEPEPLSIQIRKPSKYYKGGEIKKRHFTDVKSISSHERSKTFPGIAAAMADQWGGNLNIITQSTLFNKTA